MFIHPILLGGTALVVVPVLLHLIMRQKPKRLLFPAFRFLQQRAKTNQRKLRLRHLLLLLARMALIALICLALARPRAFSDRFTLGDDRPSACVMVIDTTPSMEYTIAGQSRLEEAKRRALELLNELPPNSRVAIIPTHEAVGEWLPSVAVARERINELSTRASGGPITSALAFAYRLFADLDHDASQSEGDPLGRILYVFSDRTRASWDVGRVPDLKQQLERLGPPAVRSAFIDVGTDKPINVSISSCEVTPQAVPANFPVTIRATVTATGQGCDTELLFRIAGDNATDRQGVKLDAGGTQNFEFTRKGLKPGFYQAEMSLATSDALIADNVRYLTFEVRGPRQILAITDDDDFAIFWRMAVDLQGWFTCDVRAPGQVINVEDLRPYQVVCLLSTRKPGDGLWAMLARYVEDGGHLAVIPGRDDVMVSDYNSDAAQKLLPGRLEDAPIKVEAALGLPWRMSDPARRHPILAKFREWDQMGVEFMQRPPGVNRYWNVTGPAENVLIRYAGKDSHAALLERVADKGKGGKVLMFTTPLDDRRKFNEAPWNDFLNPPSFYVSIANETLRYLVGDLDGFTLNYICGQPVIVSLPLSPRFPEYTLNGPGITGSDVRLPRDEAAADLRVTLTHTPGNFTVSGGNRQWYTRYSLNSPPGEFILDRAAVEEIEGLMGPSSVVPVAANQPLTQVMEDRMRQPMELFPYLMVLLLLILALENLLANRFYRREMETQAA